MAHIEKNISLELSVLNPNQADVSESLIRWGGGGRGFGQMAQRRKPAVLAKFFYSKRQKKHSKGL